MASGILKATWLFQLKRCSEEISEHLAMRQDQITKGDKTEAIYIPPTPKEMTLADILESKTFLIAILAIDVFPTSHIMP